VLLIALAWTWCLVVWAVVAWKMAPHSLVWIPVILTAPPLVLRRLWTSLGSASALLIFAILAGFSIGVLYLPAVIFLLMAAISTIRQNRK